MILVIWKVRSKVMEKKMEKMRNEIVGQNKFYGAIAALGIAIDRKSVV